MNDFSEYLKLPGKLENEEKNWLLNPDIHEKQAEVVNRVCEKYGLKSVIEIGCGTGNLEKRLNVKNYIGIDSNKQEVEIAKNKNLNDNYAFVDIRFLSINHLGRRDLVCCFAFLKHFPLSEWDYIFQKVASLGKYFVFNMQIAEETKDDGVDFHHVWKSTDGINKSIYDAGLMLLEVIEDVRPEPFFVCKKKEVK